MEYVYNKPNKVKLIRTPERAGLIRARMYGAHYVSGQVLVFVDSDCEVNIDWLQPLLTRIHETAQLLSVL
jgi:polypeptide N-acetylgalactosaminyltransferase